MISLGQKMELRQAIRSFEKQSDSLRKDFDSLNEQDRSERMGELMEFEKIMTDTFESIGLIMSQREREEWRDVIKKAGQEKDIKEKHQPELFDDIVGVSREDSEYVSDIEVNKRVEEIETKEEPKITGCLGSAIQENLDIGGKAE